MFWVGEETIGLRAAITMDDVAIGVPSVRVLGGARHGVEHTVIAQECDDDMLGEIIRAKQKRR